MAGDGELRSALEAEASALGDRIRFLGWAADLRSLYAALDVVVLTSLNEGTPVALIEAHAAARPVVATDVGGVGDVVEHGINGFLAGSDDAEGLARGVLELVEDPGRARRMGEAGRARVAERHSAARIAAETAELSETTHSRLTTPR